MKYALEIYFPQSSKPDAYFESTSPFMSINVGDTLTLIDYGAPLIVTKVEHFVWEAQGNVTHKIRIETREDRGFRAGDPVGVYPVG